MAFGDSDSRFGGSEISTGVGGGNFGTGSGGIAGSDGGGGGGADLSGFEGSPEHGGHEAREMMTAIATQLGLEQRGLHERDNTWDDRLLNWGQDFQQRYLGNPWGFYPDHPAQNQIENVWGHGPVLDAAFNAARRGTSLQEIADRIAPREGGGATGPQGSLDNLIVVPAGFTNPPPSSIFRDERGDVQIVLPTGQAVPVRAVDNVIHIIRRGGSFNANQRAIIDAMTPAQRRAAGIFLAPDGTVRAFREVLTAAVTNAAAGRPLSSNQQAALGAAFLNTPSRGGSVHRDMVNQLAGAQRGEVRDHISRAVQDAMRATREIRRTARADTERQQRGTPARIAENAVGRLSEGRRLTARQQELYDGLTRRQQAALLDQAIAPRGRPRIVQNIVNRIAAGRALTSAQQRFLASLMPQQREVIAEPLARAERAATRTETRLRQQEARQQARTETLQERQQEARQALRQKQQAQRAAAPDDAGLARRQAQQRRQQAARQAQQLRRQGQRQKAARQVQAAPRGSAERKEARRRQRALLERQKQNRLNLERRQVAQRAVTRARQQAEAARAAHVAARQRTGRARAAQAAVAPRNLRQPLRTLSRAQQQAVLLRRAVSRRQAGVRLSERQRPALRAAPRSERRPLARQAQAAQRARAAQVAAARRAARAAQHARAARERARQAVAARATAVPRNAGPLRNLSAAEQQRLLLTRAVARRQAGIKLTPNQLRALKSSTARERRAVRSRATLRV